MFLVSGMLKKCGWGGGGVLTTISLILATTIRDGNLGDVFLRFARAIIEEFLHRNPCLQVSTWRIHRCLEGCVEKGLCA